MEGESVYTRLPKAPPEKQHGVWDPAPRAPTGRSSHAQALLGSSGSRIQMDSPVQAHFREHSGARKCGAGESTAEGRLPSLKSNFQAEKGLKGENDSQTSSLVTNDCSRWQISLEALKPDPQAAQPLPPQRSYFPAAITATPCSGLSPKTIPPFLL